MLSRKDTERFHSQKDPSYCLLWSHVSLLTPFLHNPWKHQFLFHYYNCHFKNIMQIESHKLQLRGGWFLHWAWLSGDSSRIVYISIISFYHGVVFNSVVCPSLFTIYWRTLGPFLNADCCKQNYYKHLCTGSLWT